MSMQEIFLCHYAKADMLSVLCSLRPIYTTQIALGIQPNFTKEEIDIVCELAEELYSVTLTNVYGKNKAEMFRSVILFVLTQVTPTIAAYFFVKPLFSDEELTDRIHQMFYYIITGAIE